MAKKIKNTQALTTSKVWCYNPITGYICGTDVAYPDQLNAGEYLPPANSTSVEPPTYDHLHTVKWTGSQWKIVDAIVDVSADKNVRSLRNNLLADTDWTQLPDAPLTEAQRAEFTEYRKALRDITKSKGWPKVEWPKSPVV